MVRSDPSYRGTIVGVRQCKCMMQGWTALHLAACNRSSDIIEVLCEHGANLEARTMKVKCIDAMHVVAVRNQAHA